MKSRRLFNWGLLVLFCGGAAAIFTAQVAAVPVVSPVAVLKNSKDAGAAREFMDFLQGAEARAAFEKYGFAPAEKSAVKN